MLWGNSYLAVSIRLMINTALCVPILFCKVLSIARTTVLGNGCNTEMSDWLHAAFCEALFESSRYLALQILNSPRATMPKFSFVMKTHLQ